MQFYAINSERKRLCYKILELDIVSRFAKIVKWTRTSPFNKKFFFTTSFQPTAIIIWNYDDLKRNAPTFILFDELKVNCENASTTEELNFSIIKGSCSLRLLRDTEHFILILFTLNFHFSYPRSYAVRFRTERMSRMRRFKLLRSRLTKGLSPVSQLRCVGGDLCRLVNISFLVCVKNMPKNRGNIFFCTDSNCTTSSDSFYRLAMPHQWETVICAF